MRTRGGFTLVEVLVALTISAIVLLLAHEIFSGMVDGGGSLVAARAQLDRAANARRWLAAAFLSLEVGQDSAGPFEGQSDRMRFAAWLETEHGWFERRPIVLERRAGALVADLGAPMVLADSVTDVAFDYLLEPGAETRWVREWISPVSAPLAVRIRVSRGIRTDTLFFLIKERG